MFSQQEINTAVANAIEGRFHSDWGFADGWSYESDRVVYSTHADYLRLDTDGWIDANRQRVVIKNMKGYPILCMI
jgi:hypothetical protein